MQLGQAEREAVEPIEAAAGAFSRPLFKATTEWDSSTTAALVQALAEAWPRKPRLRLSTPHPNFLANSRSAGCRTCFRFTRRGTRLWPGSRIQRPPLTQR